MRRALVLIVGTIAVFGLGLLIGLAGQGPPKRITVERTVSTVVVPPECRAALAAAGSVIAHSSETLSSANAVISAETEAIKLIGEALLRPVGAVADTSARITALQQEVQDESGQLESRKPVLDAAVADYVRAARGCRSY